jgi:hypothetical protein
MWFIAPTAATALLLWVLPWPWWALLIVDLALAAWAYGMWRRLMPQGLPGGVEALTLSADRQLRLYFADETAAEELPARVLDGTCLGDAFITFVWRKEGLHRLKRSQTLFLLPDMMSVDDWRRLRVLLQHGREVAIQESESALRRGE